MGCTHSDQRVASVRYEEESPLDGPLKGEEEIKTKRTVAGSVDTGSLSASNDSYLRPSSTRIRGVYLTVDTHLKSWDEMDESTPSPVRSKPISAPITPEAQQKRVQEFMIKPEKASGRSGRFLMTRSESFIDTAGIPPPYSSKSGRPVLARSESIVSKKSVEPEVVPEAVSQRRSSRDGSARFSLSRNESLLSRRPSVEEEQQQELSREAIFSPSSSRSRSTSLSLPPHRRGDAGIALSGSRRPSIEEGSSARRSSRTTPELPEKAFRIPRSPSVASSSNDPTSRPSSIVLAASPSLQEDVMAPAAVHQLVAPSTTTHKKMPPKKPRSPPSAAATASAVSAAVAAALAATSTIVRAPTPHPQTQTQQQPPQPAIQQPAVDLTLSEKRPAPPVEQQGKDISNNGILANIVDMLLLAHPLPRPFSNPPRMSPPQTATPPALTERETPSSPFQVVPDYVHVNPDEVLSCFYVQPDSWYKAPRPYLRVKIIPFVWWR